MGDLGCDHSDRGMASGPFGGRKARLFYRLDLSEHLINPGAFLELDRSAARPPPEYDSNSLIFSQFDSHLLQHLGQELSHCELS
jgi:hypothetical protein